jgi:hypothetical protein
MREAVLLSCAVLICVQFSNAQEKDTSTVGKDLVKSFSMRSFSFEGDRLTWKPTNAYEHWTVVFEKNQAY